MEYLLVILYTHHAMVVFIDLMGIKVNGCYSKIAQRGVTLSFVGQHSNSRDHHDFG